MDPVITTLAATAASTLVQAMTTDAWALARDRVAAVFGGGTTVQELERARGEVVEHQGLGPVVEQEWRGRLTRYLATHPEAVAQLRAVLEEVAPDTNKGGNSYGGDHIDFSHGQFQGPVTGKSVHHGPDGGGTDGPGGSVR
ncbi:hypothetical protein BJF83_24305 [Nocardiopsis sp. CNR-923]|uniref:hypothetical protein n=1 Tax=Nocardiopsis sp. CNR-923 TaxID=1904965 RepID=UPI000966B294|nr:hypothetical protein [Nocardiopsis sp. CNR-923]OLT24340.1 hypothetical protein BJF83_24305 [Nocardiopsis sp. CNR-923]